MPLREKLKRAFKTNSPASSKSSSPVIAQQPPTVADYSRWPSNVYRPDEPMPRLKYRAPVKKEHKEKLESFDFKSSWRRRSHVSVYSPMGSRLPSRRGSRVSRHSMSGQSGSGMGRESLEARRRSAVNLNPSRSNSITSANVQQADRRRVRHSLRVAQVKQLRPEPEHGNEDHYAMGKSNGGLPRLNDDEAEQQAPAININPATPLGPMPDQVLQQSVGSYFPDPSERPIRHGGRTYLRPVSLEPVYDTRASSPPALDLDSEYAAGDDDYYDYADDYYHNHDDYSPFSCSGGGGAGGYDAATTAAASTGQRGHAHTLPPPASPPLVKADSGPTGKLLVGDLVVTTTCFYPGAETDELVGAMARSRMSSSALPSAARLLA